MLNRDGINHIMLDCLQDKNNTIMTATISSVSKSFTGTYDKSSKIYYFSEAYNINPELTPETCKYLKEMQNY